MRFVALESISFLCQSLTVNDDVHCRFIFLDAYFLHVCLHSSSERRSIGPLCVRWPMLSLFMISKVFMFEEKQNVLICS